MNKLSKNDIILKDGVFDIRDDFIINFDEYNISYKEFIVKHIKRWYNDFESFLESNIYCFEIPSKPESESWNAPLLNIWINEGPLNE